MMQMAQARSAGLRFDRKDEPRVDALFRRDFRRHFLMSPDASLIARLREDFPGLADDGVAEMLAGVEALREADPLVALTDRIFAGGKEGGQLQLFQLTPNFEMAMYLAQATGAAIVTDSPFRWRELHRALRPRFSPAVGHLGALADAMQTASFSFPEDPLEIARMGYQRDLAAYPQMMGEVFGYLARVGERGPRPNWEAGVAARFGRIHADMQDRLAKRELAANSGRIRCAFPAGGIQDNTVNRLLLMSSSDHHLPCVPMAFYIEPHKSGLTDGQAILANTGR
jgi:hypothetical protein